MKYLIIGNCAAGVNALEAIREKDKQGEITVISDENYPAYCRCLISYYLAGEKKEEELLLRPKDFYEKMNARLLLGKRAVGVLAQNKKVILEDNSALEFDKLLIATGGSSKSIGISGENLEGVYKFRNLDDAKGLLKLARTSRKAVVLGGGLIGLKAAYALKTQGLEVDVIIKSSALMSQVIDKPAARILKKHLEQNGINVRTGLAANEIIGRNRVEGVALDNGEKLECEIVIVAKGVSPNIGLVKDSSIKTAEGILTDEYLKTNAEDIYAAGDCAQTYDLALGETTVNALWSAACAQGRIAGLNMAEDKRVYGGSLAENSVEFFGLEVVSLGINKFPKDAAGYEELVRADPEKLIYKRLVLKDNRLAGLAMLARFKNAGVYLSLIKQKIDITSVRNLLLADNFSFADIVDLIPQKDKKLCDSVSIEGKLF